MYFVKTPKIAQALNKKAIWNIPNNENAVYLTFDDGPTPIITDRTLDILKEKRIKATFFCLGQQVEKHPEIFQRIIEEGHTIGNHSYSHPKGWTTNNKEYIEDILKGKSIVQSDLFRPPYGKIKRSQLNEVYKTSEIIMWDILPGDFSPKNNIETVVKNVVNNVTSGSIIVLHDNNKCGGKMLKTLPLIIEKLKENKHCFLPITKNTLT